MSEDTTREAAFPARPRGSPTSAYGPTRDATPTPCSRRPRKSSPPRASTHPYARSPPRRASGPTLYRHFPLRSDLIAAVFRHEVDACADAAPSLAARYEPVEALARWLQRFAVFIATKRGLSAALHSGDPAYDTLPGYFQQRFIPVLGALLDAAAQAGGIRSDIDPDDLLRATGNLTLPAQEDGNGHTRRMVGLLVDGLRYGAPAREAR